MKKVYYNNSQDQPLQESWSSLLQQQQQQDPPAPSDPPADPGSGNPPVADDPNATITTPFDNINLEVLDDKQVAQINAAKLQYVETIKTNRALTTRMQKVEGVASKYQSEADRLKAQVAKLQPREEPKASPTENQARQFLTKQGMKPEEIEKQLPFFTGLLEHSVQIAKEEIGRDLGPMAGTVLQQQANYEFTNARSNSTFLQDAEVAQEVWDKFVQPSLQQGQTPNAASINDYAKIVFVDKGKHLQQGSNPKPPVSQPPPPPSGPAFTFPGASVLPPGNWTPPGQNNQPVVSAETDSAVIAVMSRLTSGTGIWPKGLAKPQGRK